jgi:hypothetical protein
VLQIADITLTPGDARRRPTALGRRVDLRWMYNQLTILTRASAAGGLSFLITLRGST